MDILTPRLVELSALTPHPRNYREHPPEQVTEIAASMEQHGVYQNIVVARDLTILAGHGKVLAARELGLTEILAVVLPIEPDSPDALKILAADNYLPHGAADNDRMLTELLKEIQEKDSLVGTGFTDMSLAALVMVTRPREEIADLNRAAEWVGMPEFTEGENATSLVIRTETAADRDALVKQLGLITRGFGKVMSAWWPPREREDRKSVGWDADV